MLTDRLFQNWPGDEDELFERVQRLMELSSSLVDQAEDIRNKRYQQNTAEGGIATFSVNPINEADSFIRNLHETVLRTQEDMNQLVNTTRALDDSQQVLTAYLKKALQKIEKLEKKKR